MKHNSVEEPVEIMDREVKRLKQSRIPIVKVRWNSLRGPEYTWECEYQKKQKYPNYLTKPHPQDKFQDEIFLTGGECNTSQNRSIDNHM